MRHWNHPEVVYTVHPDIKGLNKKGNATKKMIINLFISDTSSTPETVLEGPSWLQCLQYNIKEPHLLTAGKYKLFFFMQDLLHNLYNIIYYIFYIIYYMISKLVYYMISYMIFVFSLGIFFFALLNVFCWAFFLFIAT